MKTTRVGGIGCLGLLVVCGLLSMALLNGRIIANLGKTRISGFRRVGLGRRQESSLGHSVWLRIKRWCGIDWQRNRYVILVACIQNQVMSESLLELN